MISIQQRKKVAVAVAAILTVGMGGYYAYARIQGTDPKPFFGSVDVRDVNLGFRVNGRVAEVLVDEGMSVKAGQLLARLDADPYRRLRDEALATLNAATARLQLLKAGHDPEAIASAKARLDAARATLANAEKALVRTTNLRSTGATSQSALDVAMAARDEAAARTRAAEQEYAQLRNGYRREEVEEAQANVARAQAAYARAQLQVDDTELKAPEDGVVQTRAIEPGAMVETGSVSLVVTNNRDAWVRAYVDEPSLGMAVPGARVAVYTDSRKEPYAGRIGSVSPRAEFTPRTVETTSLRTSLVYRVRVLVDSPDAALRQGMPVTVRFTAQGRAS